MKKFLFLLFSVLCLVSCRTATVDNSPELETMVLVVEKDAGADATPVEAIGTDDVVVVEPSQDADAPVLEAESEASGTADQNALDGTFIPEATDEQPVDQPEESSETPVPMEESTDAVDEDSASLVAVDSAVEQPQSEETIALETVTQEPETEPVEDVSIVQDAVQSVIEETSSVDAALQVESSPKVSEVQRQLAPQSMQKVEEGSFLDRLTEFVLREKLFSFGVLTVFIGIVMLIVVLIKDLVGNGSHGGSKQARSKDSADEGKGKAGSSADEARHESSSLDDDDEFLKSLLNS